MSEISAAAVKSLRDYMNRLASAEAKVTKGKLALLFDVVTTPDGKILSRVRHPSRIRAPH